jgi:GT2 family glycosyltransferase
MRVAFIIPVTRQKELSACLQALLQQSFPHSEYEIVLIRSEGFNPDLPKTDIKIKEIIENNLHTAVRRNKGVESTDAQLLALIDDDTIVSRDWIRDAVRCLTERQIDGVCGQIKHFSEDNRFSKKLSGAAIDSFFLEGFSDSEFRKAGESKFFNMPLCNSMITRKTWEAVGGFNETAFYYMDDLEFFYLASQLGFKFYHVPELSVRHGVAPFPWKYLMKKFFTRFHVGINTWIFPEVYLKMPFIWVALLALLLFLPVFFLKPGLFLTSAWLYLLTAGLFSLPYLNKQPMITVCLPGVFFLTHLTNLVAFIAGLLTYAVCPWRFVTIKSAKQKRFVRCLR